MEKLLLLLQVKKGMREKVAKIIEYNLILSRATKDLPSIEILADDPEPTTFAGHLLISGLSLSCRLISAEMQQTQLYRLICSSSLSQLTMPLPIIPVLQSGPTYPGKQSLVKYFMLIPTVKMVHNEEVKYP